MANGKWQSKPPIHIIRKGIANELNYTEVRNNGRQSKELRCQEPCKWPVGRRCEDFRTPAPRGGGSRLGDS